MTLNKDGDYEIEIKGDMPDLSEDTPAVYSDVINSMNKINDQQLDEEIRQKSKNRDIMNDKFKGFFGSTKKLETKGTGEATVVKTDDKVSRPVKESPVFQTPKSNKIDTSDWEEIPMDMDEEL